MGASAHSQLGPSHADVEEQKRCVGRAAPPGVHQRVLAGPQEQRRRRGGGGAMIYICKGCGEICMLPCRACEALCNVIGSSCKCFSDLFRPIVEGPLASYVLGTWACMLFAVAAGAYGIVDSECPDARIAMPAALQRMACGIFVGLAAVHAGFAYYLQHQIVSGLARKGLHPSSHSELAKEAMHILLYDFGVCLYVVIYIGSFGFACYSFAMLSCGAGAGYGAAILLIVYGWIASTYLLAWYFCNCCAGAVMSHSQSSKQIPPPQQQPVMLGAPMPPQGP